MAIIFFFRTLTDFLQEYSIKSCRKNLKTRVIAEKNEKVLAIIKKFERNRKKMLTNTGTGASITKLSDRDSEKYNTSVVRLKKAIEERKKAVDKLLKQ